MPSNSLSKRRDILKRPIVCKKGPPPIPAPVDWPPGDFDLHFTYDYFTGPILQTVDFTTTFTLSDPPGNLWIGDQSTNEANQLNFSLDPTDNTGDIIIGGDNVVEGGYTISVSNIPIAWNTPATYVLETWDFVPWWMIDPHADFTF